MQKAVLYARVSSREQREEGYSIDAQLRLLREYSEKHGFTLLREFIEAESAKATGRTEFSAMLTFLRKNPTCRIVLVEKTDRLYRNFSDAVEIEKLDLQVHFAKENSIVSKDAKSQAKFIHDIHLAVAKNYSNNLREEVKKGMAEKVAQGGFPHKAPFGYRNNPVTRSLELHPENAQIVRRIFELYATGNHSLISVRNAIRNEFGKRFAKAYVHKMLLNPFYIGMMRWKGELHNGSHAPLVSHELFQRVRDVFNGHNRGKYGKREIAFRGLLHCAHDGCLITGEVKKEKYTYYRCSGFKGKCETPRFTEPEIAAKMGELLKDIYVPLEVVDQISANLETRQREMRRESDAQRERLELRLTEIRRKMDRAFAAKLDGSVDEETYQRGMTQMKLDADTLKLAIAGFSGFSADKLLDAKRILELANRAYSLYISQNSTEQAKLLKTVLWNCDVDEVSLYPVYRKPFDLIFQRAKNEEWSGRADLNCRPLAPQASALPG
jgi:site-specific DNA recombinase